MKEWITKVFVMGFCMVAVADTTYEPENDGRTLVVTVPSGETNVFDYVNYKDALTGNVYTNVVKRGTGCLDMKDSIEAFTGDFAVESGTLRYWSQFALGWTNINCTVTVNDGATLAVHGDQSYPKFNLGA